jgi:hypothetical protein
MTISKFGQQVELEVFGPGGALVFSSGGLKVDFDIVHIPGFSRATFKIWNMDPRMIGEIQNGERYCRLTATLHDDTPMILADDFFVSNSVEEAIPPNSVTTLYTVSKLRKSLLEKTTTISVKEPSLKNIMVSLKQETKFTGRIIYKNFPKAITKYAPPRKVKDRTGSVQGLLDALAQQYRFKYYTVGVDLVLMYQPTGDNVKQTDMYTREPDVELDSNNMEANPKIGVAELQVSCNLDNLIIPTAILDTSQLITASADADELTLQLVKGYLKQAVAGFSKYQAITVRHQGSNFTKQWTTTLTATAPSRGISMPTYGWLK